jgi:hypothetical protein
VAEHRFRIAAPNSWPRSASLVALDAASVDAVREAVAQAPERRRLVVLPPGGDAWLRDLQGQTRGLIDAVEQSDMMVMVATAGYAGHDAGLIGDACRPRGVSVTSVVVGSEDASDADVAVTLARLRPFAGMIVVAGTAAYVGDMLMALRA